MGFSQLQRIDQFVSRRNELASRYDSLLRDLPLKIPMRQPESCSAFHLYVIQLELEKIVKSRRSIFDELCQAGIGVNVHYIPVHTQPYYRNLGFKRGDFPIAENYYERALSLPLYYDLSESNQDMVVDALKTAVV